MNAVEIYMDFFLDELPWNIFVIIFQQESKGNSYFSNFYKKGSSRKSEFLFKWMTVTGEF